MSYPITVQTNDMARYVEELGRIGEQPGGGMVRFQYDAAWAEARDLLCRWIEEAGLEPHVDAVGNVYGRLVGEDDSRTILTGSHVDTVPQGGKYDGALGILAGLAALKELRAQSGRPRRSVEVVALCEEESSRFQANFFGTRAIVGLVTRDELDESRDVDGHSMATAMESVGLDPDQVGTARRKDLDVFLELHIEQGRNLQDTGIDIGVVDVVTGLVWERFTVQGRADHAGGTPMDLRLDAMQAAAEMSLEISRNVEDAGRPGVVTFGQWAVRPGWPSIVPASVDVSMDLRHPDQRTLNRLVEEAHAIAHSVAGRRNVQLSVAPLKDEAPTVLDPGLQAVLTESAARCGATTTTLSSGAGHDSQLMAHYVPTAMLFVPSLDGRSHCPEEFTDAADCARGASVLATALHQLAY